MTNEVIANAGRKIINVLTINGYSSDENIFGDMLTITEKSFALSVPSLHSTGKKWKSDALFFADIYGNGLGEYSSDAGRSKISFVREISHMADLSNIFTCDK